MRSRLQEAWSKLFEAAKEYARNSNDSRAGKITYIDNIRIESHSISPNLMELVFYGNAMGAPFVNAIKKEQNGMQIEFRELIRISIF